MLDNEYVRDSETGDVVYVGDKGGNETDYVYEGTIERNVNGEVEYIAYSEVNVEEIDVEVEYTSGPDKNPVKEPTPGSRLLHGKTPTDIQAYSALLAEFLAVESAVSYSLGFSALSRKKAIQKAKDFSKVPRKSKGGEDILIDELRESSRGNFWKRMMARGAKILGKRNPKGKNKWMEHPDGHPNKPGPKHHRSGHVHATNPKGEEKIFLYGKK
jgi:hypothetical protein